MAEKHLILGIGEVLWDLLPDGPRLGGAPANFAVMAARLGNHSVLLSRLGRDNLGGKAVEQLRRLPVDTLSKTVSRSTRFINRRPGISWS
jgi:fructokinase